MEQPLNSHSKKAVVAVGIVTAVFYAVLEEGVSSGSIPYAASYITLAVWLLCHIFLVMALMKDNYLLARRYILSSVVANTLLVLAWTTVVTKLSISPWTIPFWVDITIFFTISIVWWCQVPLQLPHGVVPNELAHEIPLEGVSCSPEQAVDGTFPVRDLENGTS